MNQLQSRLVTILRNIDAPVTAEQIRVRCQLPQDEGQIACNLRGLARQLKIRQWAPGCFVHRGYKYRGDEKRTPVVQPPKGEKPVSKIKVNGSEPPQGMPNKPTAAAVDAALAVLSELSAMKEAPEPHLVEDAELKIAVLRHFQEISPPHVSEMLGRVIDEDVMPFSTGAVEA